MDVSHLPAHQQKAVLAMNKDRPLASTGTGEEHARATLDRYIDGQSLADQAIELKVSRARLHKILITYAEDDWRSAQISRAMVTLEDAENELANAALTPANVDVSRAREKARLAQWKLERLLSRLFAQKQEVTYSAAPSIDKALIGVASDILSKIAKTQAIPAVSVDVTDVDLSTHNNGTLPK